MAKRKDIVAERLKKLSLWIARTAQVTGYSEETVQELLNTPRTQSIRLNPLKPCTTPVELKPIEWCDNGFELPKGYIPDETTVTNGEVYIQNAASWLPVLALDPQPGEVILDVCAAPGGKASHIQAITGNRSKLTCNDNSKPRLLKLQRNMERLGAEANYTLCDATRLSRIFSSNPTSSTRPDLVAGSGLVQGYFDKILLDAPCSGEGLMTLDDMKLFDSWSVAHIRRLSDLQKKILSESWKLLKPGGTLVYSTCTMAPEENEAVIDHFLRKHPDARLEPIVTGWHPVNRVPAVMSWNGKDFETALHNCLRLVPGDITEAFFVTKLTKQ